MAQLTDQDVRNEGFEIYDFTERVEGYKFAIKFPLKIRWHNSKWMDDEKTKEITDLKKERDDKIEAIGHK